MGSKNISDIKEVMNALGIKDFSQNNPHHFGTFEQHVGAVVNDDMIQNDKSGIKDLLKIAAIMHDIGKADVKDINPKTGYDRYIGHDKRSAEIFDENADKLFSSLSDDQKQYVHDLIALHHARYAKEGKCRDMLDSHPSGFAADLLKLDTADVRGQSHFKEIDKLTQVKDMGELIKRVGTPEQAEGVDEVLKEIDETIKREQEYVEEQSKPREVTIPEQRASSSSDIKYKDLYDIACANGIEDYVDNYGSDYCSPDGDVSISYFQWYDESPLEAMYKVAFDNVNIDGEIFNGTYEFEDGCSDVLPMPEDELLDYLNKQENRTKEPIPKHTEMVEPEKKVWLVRTAIGVDKDGNKIMPTDIYIDEADMGHLEAHGNVKKADIIEAYGKMVVDQNKSHFNKHVAEVEMGRTVGNSDVKTVDKDTKISLAYRKGHDKPSIVALDQQGDKTSKMFMGTCMIPDKYEDFEGTEYAMLYSYGEATPKEPLDPSLTDKEKAESKLYWLGDDTHPAHVLTVTKDQIDAEKTEQLAPINEYLGRQPSDAKTVATAFAISAVIAESSKDEVPFIIKAIQKAEKGTEKTANTPVKKHQSFLEDIKNIHKEMGADDGISSLSDKNKDKDGQNISY